MPKKEQPEVQVRLTRENTAGAREIKRETFASIPAIVNQVFAAFLLKRQKGKK